MVNFPHFAKSPSFVYTVEIKVNGLDNLSNVNDFPEQLDRIGCESVFI